MEKPTINNQIDQFVAAVQRGIEAFEEGGRILVALLDSDPKAKQKIIDRNPLLISENVIETFERIGRKQLYYRLSINESIGVKALQNCPFSEQVKYADEPIPLLLLRGDNKTDELQVPVTSLTRDQVRQVFGARRLRTLGEQRAYLESQKKKPLPLARGHEPYRVSKGKVVIYEPCTLSVADLGRLITEAGA